MQNPALPQSTKEKVHTASAALVLCVVLSSYSLAQRGGFRQPTELPHEEHTLSTGGQRQFDQAKAIGDMKSSSAKQPIQAQDALKLNRDADELSKLAQSIPSSVDQTTKGILPKDLDQRLKRIEKLAKQLRSQISH